TATAARGPAVVRKVRLSVASLAGSGLSTVRKLSKPGAVDAPAKENTLPREWAPAASWPPATSPEPTSRTTYKGRSAAIGTGEVTRADTPTRSGPRPPGDEGFDTSTVVRSMGGTVTCRVVTCPCSS